MCFNVLVLLNVLQKVQDNLLKINLWPVVVAHTINLSNQEAETGGPLCVQG